MMVRMHIIPIGDIDIHYAQSTCWCHPLEKERNIFMHNAKDCREVKERLTNKGCSEGWVIIKEKIS